MHELMDIQKKGWPALPEFPRVSIVIPMFNERDAIVRCIESIRAQDYPADRIEIWVVDGESTDGCRQQVLRMAESDRRIRLLENPRRRTPIGLNIGIRHATGDVIIILGAHTQITPTFIRKNIEVMREKGVVCTGGTQKNVGETYMQQAIGLAMGSPIGMPSAPYRFGKTPRYVDTVVYAAYRRALFEEIGYFDEDLLISEDAELNWRIRKAGYRIFFTPEIVSYYYPRRTLGRLIHQFFRYGILRVNVIRKHKDAAKPIHLLPMAMLLASVVLLVVGFFHPLGWRFLFGLGAVYGAGIVIASLTIGFRAGLRYIPILTILFVAMHLSWGVGFIVGLLRDPRR